MHAHIRAIVAACTHAVIIGRKVAGVYDHASGRHLRIAAECRGDRVQGFDGERSTRFGGILPELYDQGEKAFVTLETDGLRVRGYDRGTACFYDADVTERVVQLYDDGERAWFAFDIQMVESE